MAGLDVSIIIISFNTKELLRSCINSIKDVQGDIQYEIIVVDNDSQDGSPEMIRTHFAGATLISNQTNVGFAKGNNQAFKIARGRYLFLLNSDSMLRKGTLETLLEFMEGHPKAAAVGPKVLNFDGSLQSKGFCFPSVLLSLIILFRIPKFLSQKELMKWFSKYYWGEDEVRRVDWISGCCFLMRRDVVEEIGPLCEEFFMYHEDEEWCFRAKKNKYEVWYVPDAEVKHKNQSSPLTDRFDIGTISAKKYYKKTIGTYQGILISMIYILSNMVKLLRLTIQTKNGDEYEETKRRLKSEIRFVGFMLV